MTSKAWLVLGANLGDPAAQLAEAIRRIDDHPRVSVIRQSSVLVTKPWGKTDQPDFLNQAVGVETTLEPIALLDVVLDIELAMGRVREEVWGPRLIDIDMIAYDRLEMTSPRLTLPHPYAHERDFVLTPLGEIAPDVAGWIKLASPRPR
ncbi:MAG: 2-amino-4-hydroxy-6-hydroxymethyldihydropteridine diphosphokinase [Devosia sp.]